VGKLNVVKQGGVFSPEEGPHVSLAREPSPLQRMGTAVKLRLPLPRREGEGGRVKLATPQIMATSPSPRPSPAKGEGEFKPDGIVNLMAVEPVGDATPIGKAAIRPDCAVFSMAGDE